MTDRCPTCFGTGRRPDVERMVCMFCSRTSEETRYIFTTDNEHFGIVSICEHCIKEASTIIKSEEAKEVKFEPKGPR